MNLKTFRLLSLFFLLFALFPAFTSVKAESSPDYSALDAYLKEQVRKNRMPGLAAAVIQDGQVVFLKGYGVDPQAQFVLGSTTKSFTALAIMQLVEAGKLELDAPVQQYIPWFRVADPQASAQITIRHLLNQTSGLVATLDPGAEKFYSSLEEQVRALSNARQADEPGQSYRYFNQNYRVLGLLIEEASQQSYADYLRDHIFTPLGMTNTVTDPSSATRMAQAYTQVFSFPAPAIQPFHADALPSGYLISNAEDSARYLAALLAGGEYAGQQIITPETLNLMFSAPAGVDSAYGMGWMVIDDDELGGKAYYHNGALDCFASDFLMMPERGMGLVLLYNQNSLFSMLTVHEQVLVGTVEILMGEPVTSSGAVWPGRVLAGIVILDLLNHLRLFWQLPAWTARFSRQPVWRRAALAAAEIAFPLAIVIWLPGIIVSTFGEAGGWVDIYTVLPDVVVWILAGCLLTLVRGLTRMLIIAYRAMVKPAFSGLNSVA